MIFKIFEDNFVIIYNIVLIYDDENYNDVSQNNEGTGNNRRHCKCIEIFCFAGLNENKVWCNNKNFNEMWKYNEKIGNYWTFLN